MSELPPAFPLTGVKASQKAASAYLQNTLSVDTSVMLLFKLGQDVRERRVVMKGTQ